MKKAIYDKIFKRKPKIKIGLFKRSFNKNDSKKERTDKRSLLSFIYFIAISPNHHR